jgi:CubicO group peptidase (beta-lactamase class C family)
VHRDAANTGPLFADKAAAPEPCINSIETRKSPRLPNWECFTKFAVVEIIPYEMSIMNAPQIPATLANWRLHPQSPWAFRNVDKLLPVAAIHAAAAQPLVEGRALSLDQLKIDWQDNQLSLAEVINTSNTDAFIVLHDGKIVAERYINGDAKTRHIMFSVSKSVTAILCGALAGSGKLDPDAPVTTYVPEVANSVYGDCTVRHVLDMTVAINFVEDYLDPKGDFARYRVATGWNPPGAIPFTHGLHGFLATLKRGPGKHGARFDYVSPNSDLLGWIVERAGSASFADLVSRHIWQPIGAETDAYVTVDAEGAARAAGGICMTLRDAARFGNMLANHGRINGKQIIPTEWIDDIVDNGDPAAWQAGKMTHLFPNGRYRSKWYVPGDPPGAFCAIGIHGQWIFIDPNSKTVIVKQSSQPIPVDDPTEQLLYTTYRAIVRHYT